jgi:hypothetical protein
VGWLLWSFVDRGLCCAGEILRLLLRKYWTQLCIDFLTFCISLSPALTLLDGCDIGPPPRQGYVRFQHLTSANYRGAIKQHSELMVSHELRARYEGFSEFEISHSATPLPRSFSYHEAKCVSFSPSVY